MMVPFHRRLSVRLSALFLALLIAMSGVLVWVAIAAADRAAIVADEALHRDLAMELAPQFQPYLNDRIGEAAIQEMIDDLTRVNRRLDVYLLGPDGRIKSWFMDARRRPLIEMVPTEPLDHMIGGGALPVLGVDPARPDAERPFSVAHVRIMGEEMSYLYIILQGERYDVVADAVRGDALVGIGVRGVLLALGVTGLTGIALVLLVLRRLTALTETVGAFERGEHDVRAEVATRDEVGVLAGAFNRMAMRIQGQVAVLQHTDSLRRSLVANVSHDLRSPLAGLRGYLETLQMRPDVEGAEREDYLDRALQASERLSALVSDLFDLARFDAAEVRVHPEPVALEELAHDVVAEARPHAEREGVELRLRAADGLPLVRLDAGLVERALANLLDNALRHTPAHGSVEVGVSRAGSDTVAIAVRDTGDGIPPDVLDRVFDRFVRGDASRPADGGAGLGLAIVKRIAELHGGSVRVESMLGAGATFTVTLPIGGPPAAVRAEGAAPDRSGA